MSSVHSFNEEGRFVHADNFIRIEEKENQDFNDSEEEEIMRYESSRNLCT